MNNGQDNIDIKLVRLETAALMLDLNTDKTRPTPTGIDTTAGGDLEETTLMKIQHVIDVVTSDMARAAFGVMTVLIMTRTQRATEMNIKMNFMLTTASLLHGSAVKIHTNLLTLKEGLAMVGTLLKTDDENRQSTVLIFVLRFCCGKYIECKFKVQKMRTSGNPN